MSDDNLPPGTTSADLNEGVCGECGEFHGMCAECDVDLGCHNDGPYCEDCDDTKCRDCGLLLEDCECEDEDNG